MLLVVPPWELHTYTNGIRRKKVAGEREEEDPVVPRRRRESLRYVLVRRCLGRCRIGKEENRELRTESGRRKGERHVPFHYRHHE
ncbi:unnamed protein product [Allacma fusca]|uniref:Uncharacterized protein n=1 Tax=Allacma fusca TaxID=39272 RepID=A0A8J2L669_9HEXA|nr:unnamed protein product [Allacma fusca]